MCYAHAHMFEVAGLHPPHVNPGNATETYNACNKLHVYYGVQCNQHGLLVSLSVATSFQATLTHTYASGNGHVNKV